jgi:hypothetical protein
VRVAALPGPGSATSDCRPLTAQPASAIPATFPKQIELLPGSTLLQVTESTSPNFARVVATVPGDFHDVVGFYRDRLPGWGFTVTRQEAESGEAEVFFMQGKAIGQVKAAASLCPPGDAAYAVIYVPR